MKLKKRDIKLFINSLYLKTIVSEFQLVDKKYQPVITETSRINPYVTNKFVFYSGFNLADINAQIEANSKEVLAFNGLVCIKASVQLNKKTGLWEEKEPFIDCSLQWQNFLKTTKPDLYKGLLETKGKEYINFKQKFHFIDWQTYSLKSKKQFLKSKKNNLLNNCK